MNGYMGEMSKTMQAYFSLNCLIDETWNELTYARNFDHAAGYEETVIHVLLHTEKGQEFGAWSLDNCKSVSSENLDRMVKDGLLKKRVGRGRRNAYSSPVWTRII